LTVECPWLSNKNRTTLIVHPGPLRRGGEGTANFALESNELVPQRGAQTLQ